MSYTEARVSWQPDSFVEMGVLMPFTTPDLAGARARTNLRGLELTLPNPAGRRGIYILDPRELGRSGTASVHDRELASRLAEFDSVSPSAVCEGKREVAQQGFAGCEARNRVRTVLESERRACLAMQLALLRQLVGQTGGSGDAAGLDRAARTAIQAVATRAGKDPALVTSLVETLARRFGPLGLAGDTAARVPELLSAVASMVAALEHHEWQPGGRASRAAALIISVANDTLEFAARALKAARQPLAQLPGLLVACSHDIGPLEILLDRVDWLLESWTQICLVWNMAPPNRTSAAVCEMALMTPFIPVEAGAWYGIPVNEGARQALRADVLGYSDWRNGGLALELLARNEAIRAAAA